MMSENRANQRAVVIEDDPDVGELLATLLRELGFDVAIAADGLAGLQLVRELSPAITTLDLIMPGIDGFETLRRIRALSSTRIVMVSGRTDEIDVVLGLGSGADDFIAKPFRPREVRAHIEAVLRRPTDYEDAPVSPATAPDARWLNAGDVWLHASQREALFDGQVVPLTRSEFELLTGLALADGRVCSKEQLIGMLRLRLRGEGGTSPGLVTGSDKRALEVHVANLRRKFDDVGAHALIETVRGIGYRVRADRHVGAGPGRG